MREQSNNDINGSSDEDARVAEECDDSARLLQSFSHDVATPLANVKMAAAVLASSGGQLPEEKLAELSTNLSSEADRLRHMVDTVVEWSRFAVGIGKRQLHVGWHLVEDLIGSALRASSAVLDDHRVVVTIVPDMAFVRGDEALIETVLIHLIDNACRCTPSGEAVEMVARADDLGCTIEVIDAGPRLDDEEVKFDPTRLNARQGRSGTSGVSLGLDLSRMIIEAHDGEIWARNRNDESGAVFAFVLGYGGESPPHAPVEATLGDDGTD